ncbi:hypothetical protein FHX44_111743 [Pseudonocardia hierapolitana]|uniref:Peptidase C39-like protein n=1 Tax=Pseudonocardia hierapolitana TaxID=1128676 RepID=A0A561SLW3_9PSEU|nr:hypothetical protein [Pseudonocardia hierapolitana]TWF75858.1 hypothetical protein FHX44_111743 [Pseudonocardia hierapolitana]
MRTVVGVARWIGSRVGRVTRRPPPEPVARVRPLAAGRRPLLSDRLGEQRRGGARLDQVNGTTCGSAVLIALAAWADPAEMQHLDGEEAATASGSGVAAGAQAGVTIGFGARYDARQKEVHRQSTRFWPQALGTTPWGMVGWLRRHVPAAGPYRVRLVDDVSAADVDDVLGQAGAALAAGRPVPLLVGSLVPRHYVLALGVLDDGRWRVYEPTSGQIRALDLRLVRERRLASVLGFDRLHAALLPA